MIHRQIRVTGDLQPSNPLGARQLVPTGKLNSGLPMPVKKKAPGQVTGPGEQPVGSSGST